MTDAAGAALGRTGHTHDPGTHPHRALPARPGLPLPGCDRKPAWTDGHHIIYWANGGRTELDNLVSLCRPHHRTVHEEGWRIHLADGVAVVEPPP